MSRSFNLAVGVGVAVALGGGLSPHVSHAQAVSAGAASPRAFLDQYCVMCHSDSQYQRGLEIGRASCRERV